MSVNGSPRSGKIVQAVFSVSQNVVAGVGYQAVKAGFMGDDPMQSVMKLGIISEYLTQLFSFQRIFRLPDETLQLIN